ncbi:MAG: 50S ribosomal protein L25/general stress protein Ctc [Gammaproteobacteria bacterium]|nr:50S ribosomal protein L25/general stress protein Ctc [Gammaproteobacteria bacterium]
MAIKKFEVEAAIRSNIGRGASRQLRREEKVPAIIYGGGKDPVALTLAHNKISKSLDNEAFYSHILTLKIDTDSEKVILKDVQRHPFKPKILHVDFQRVRADEKLYMHVPLHFIGADKAPGVREAGGVISHIMSDVEVACFPDDLPEFIEIDLSNMQLNETYHLSDLVLPKGVEIAALVQGNNSSVVSIHIPRAEEEEVIPTEAPTAAEVPAIAQKGDEKKEGEGK